MVEHDSRIPRSHLVLSSLCNGDQRLRVTSRCLVLSSPRSRWSTETSCGNTPWPPCGPPSLTGGCGFLPSSHLAVKTDPTGCWQLLLWLGAHCKMVEHVKVGQVRGLMYTLSRCIPSRFHNAGGEKCIEHTIYPV